jgi:uncharacterized protein (DUF2236 family)
MPVSALPVSARINAERLVILGWGRAILLQLAHPLMAAAVEAHSSFRGGPLASARRLHHTVRAMLHLTYGDAETRARAIAGIRAIHDRVPGTLAAGVGPFARGTPYSAHDPALLLWVHLTLVESIALAHDVFVRPLAASERDTYCEESSWVAAALGADPATIPHTWAALRDGIAGVEQRGVLVVSDTARSLANAVLSPPLDVAVWPAAWLNRQFTIGTLPAGIRRQYGFEWTGGDQMRLDRAARTVRAARRIMPRRVAQWHTGIRRSPSTRPAAT